MAKRKRRPIALFEVISKSRDERRPVPTLGKPPASSLLSTPKWWFKRKSCEAVNPAEMPAPVSSVASPARPVDRDSAVAVIAPPAPPSVIAERIILESPLPEPEYDDGDVATATAESDDPAYDAVFDHERAQTVHVAVDPERRQIALRMSYTAAIVGGFAAVVVVVLSVIVGQRMSHSGVPLLASSTTSELRAGPAHPGVLEPAPRKSSSGNAAQAAAARGQPTSSSSEQPGRTTPQTAEQHAVQPPTPAPAPEKVRYIGLNYIIVQSYPDSEEKLAVDSAKFLTAKGYPCTVVRDVKGFMKLSVVTLEGFDKQSSPNFKNYSTKITALSGEFTGGNRSYKAFSPVGKKWDKQD